MSSTLGRWQEGALMSAIFGIIVLVTMLAQPPLTVNDGRGWDGNHYYHIAEQLVAGQAPVEDAPFAYRVAIPWLDAELFPSNLMLGFRLLNAAAIVVTFALMVVWLRLHIRLWPVRMVLMALFLAQWSGPLRYYVWYPTLSDYWLVAAVLAGLLVIEQLRRGGRPLLWVPALCVVSMFAVAVREAGLLIPLAALFTYNPITGSLFRVPDRLRDLLRIPRALAVPIAAAGSMLALIRVSVVALSSYGFLRAAVGWLLRKWPTMYLLAWLIAFGPVLVLPAFYWRTCARFLREHQALAAYLLAVFGIGWIGGGDTERFLTWVAPIIYVLIGLGLTEFLAEPATARLLRGTLIVILTVTQAISERLFWVVPATPSEWESDHSAVFLTPLGSNVSMFNLTSWDAAPSVRLQSEAEYAIVVLLLLGLLYLIHRQHRRVVG